MDGSLKSQASIMLSLMQGLSEDLCKSHLYSVKELAADMRTISSRTRAEGPSYLTITLPKLGKAFDTALKIGTFHPPIGFAARKGTKYPKLFYRLFEKVFYGDGLLREEPCIHSIQDIRQITYMFYKYELPYDKKLVKATVADFINIDSSIKPLSPNAEVQGSIYYGQKVVAEVLKNFSFTQSRPKNGPGAVANGKKPWQRYRPHSFYECLDDLIEYSSLFYFNERHLFDHFSDYFNLPEESHGVAKLMVVPKDSRGPRIISSEQSEFMVYQQALKNELVPYIEQHRLTCQQVNFTDQTINGELALSASATGDYATLDLSAASDRLSLDLVEGLFEDTSILRYLLGSRSEETSISKSYSDVECVKLRKFAPMGSALCFPIQALSFYALLVGRMVALGERLDVACKMVWVYGDDIIVPTEFTSEAVEVLESVGLKINADKSCYTGQFRESCGVDAYNGVDITPIKISELWVTLPPRREKKKRKGLKDPAVKRRKPRLAAGTILSWVATCNNLFLHGYWQTSNIIRGMIEDSGYDLPVVSNQSSAIGYSTYSKEHAVIANEKKWLGMIGLQCRALSALVANSRPKLYSVPGWENLLRIQWSRPKFEVGLLDMEWDEFLDYHTTHGFSHGECDINETLSAQQYTDRHSVKLKRAWVTETDI
mgnify:CR=1 FL=1